MESVVDQNLKKYFSGKKIFVTGHTGFKGSWLSNKKLDTAFIENFNKANLSGLQQLDKVINENPYVLFDLTSYYTSYINYNLNDKAKEGLYHFLNILNAENIRNLN